MSIFRLEIQHVLYILRVSGKITGTWPPNSKASSCELLLSDLGLCVAILNVLGLAIPLVLTACSYENNILILMKALSELTSLAEVFFNLILCRIGRKNLQKLLTKIEDSVKSFSERENTVIRKYIDRYLGFSVFVVINVFLAAIAFCCGPAFQASNLPAEGKYPFSTEPPIRRSVIYLLQVIAIWQTAFGYTVDFMVAMCLWFCSAKIDILRLELDTVRNENQMKLCVRKHQEIIEFVEETQSVVRYLILKTNATVASSVIFGAFPLVYNQPATVMAQFISMLLVNCQRLYVTAWPADDLYETSQKIAFSAYDTRWLGELTAISGSVLFMIQRSQKPLRIRIAAFCPEFSLQYYSSFLKTVSSFFMTMRAAIGD